jgi:hypothetical protein
MEKVSSSEYNRWKCGAFFVILTLSVTLDVPSEVDACRWKVLALVLNLPLFDFYFKLSIVGFGPA